MTLNINPHVAATDEKQLHAYMISFFSSLPTACECKRDLDYRQTDKLRVFSFWTTSLLTTTERYITHVTTDVAAIHLSISPEFLYFEKQLLFERE